MRYFALILFSILCLSFNLSDWKLIHSSDDLKISFKSSDCLLDNAFKQRWFLLEFKNTSASKIKVTWDLELLDENKKCVTCSQDNGEYQYSLILEPNQTLRGECASKCGPELRVVSKILDVKTSMSYPEFNLKNVKVIKLSN
ncbi:MAG: hypothetical protein ACK452_05635 [Bacteroidota bacterium]|jgi:hypothetical protein